MEQFDQLLTCAICLDRYRNPKLLPCQHSFCCEPCMDGLVDYVRRQVKCPECRAEHRIPYQGVQGFPTNVTLQRFLELHMDITGELPDPTAGMMMERCSVCSEKSYCYHCAHCDKKCCPECKEAHIDILKREIARVNNQVKRLMHRLKDSLQQIDKNSVHLQSNCKSVTEEVEDITKRLMKALKERSEYLKREIERYLTTEIRTMATLRENLEQEISNIESNAELADKYITDGNYDWEDAELMDAKETFLKTIEFVRNFEYDVTDYARRAKFHNNQDSGNLVALMASFGDIIINKPKDLSMEQPSIAPGLMRSKSDHRLATQFRQQEEKYGYGDSEGRLSPVRRYADRYNSRRPSTRYNFEEEGDYDSEPKTRSKYRSRFARNVDVDSDSESNSRNVRFQDGDRDTKAPRERVLDTEDATRGPLSGVTRLFDSPRVIKKIQEGEIKQRKRDAPVKAPTPAPKTPPITQPPKKTQRQISEEDEITKIKKMNKQHDAAFGAGASSPKPMTDRVSLLKKEENKRVTTSTEEEETTSSRRNQPSSKITSRVTPETGTRPRISCAVESESPTESDESNRRKAKMEKTPATKKLSAPGRLAEQESEAPKQSRKFSMDETNKQGAAYSRSSSSSSLNINEESKAAAATASRPNRALRRSLSTSSANSSSAESSRRSSPVRNTGAAFTTDEIKNKFDSKPSTRPSSRASNTDAGATAAPTLRSRTSNTRTETTASPTSRRFQSRFLGRAGTPTVEASKESESSSSSETSSSSEESSESESEEDAKPIPDRKINKTDIGPLLARSANAREASTPEPKKEETSYSSRYGDSNNFARSRTSSSLYNNPKTESNYNNDYSSTRSYGQTSRTSSTANNRRSYPYTSEKEPATTSYNRYMNRSRPSLDTGDSSTSRYGDTSSRYGESSSRYGDTSSRYGKYTSRFLNKSKSSAALAAPEQTEGEEEEDSSPPWRISNEERYPSGRSRIAAIKERRARLARSKSSADLGEQEETTPEKTFERDGTGSHLSTWARYLKNKYGNRNKEKSLSRSNSLVGEASPDSSEEEKPTNSTIANLSINTPRAQYLAKRKVIMKLGSRGSEAGLFTWPRGIAVTPDNNIVVADSSNHRVQIFTQNGQFIKEFGSYGNAEAEFDCLAGVAVNRIGQYIIADRYNHRIQVFDPAGRFLRSFGSQGSADGRFSYPWGITTDALGFIYVCDKENHRIQVFQSDGTFVGKFGTIGGRPGQLEHPHYIAVTTTNRVIVSDSNNHRIQIFDVNGKVITTFGSEGSDEGQFKFPRGVAVDEQGYIFIGDSGNNRIQIFHPDGTFLSAFGSWGSGDGEFKGLEGLAVTSNGKILVCDRENHRVQMF